MINNLLKKAKVKRKVEGLISRILPSWSPLTPSFAQIEISTHCNLKCVMCPREHFLGGGIPKNMTLENFKKIVAQLPRLSEVDLQGLGEPLINPELDEIITWCNSQAIRASFVTNGLLLGPDRASALLRTKPSRIIISLDSTDPETYASIRPGASLKLLMENIGRLVALRAEMEGGPTHIGLMAVVMKLNERELPELVMKARELSVDSITLKGLNTVLGGDPCTDDLQDPILRKTVAEAKKVGRMEVITAFHGERRRLKCRWPWLSTYITVDGHVTPCCNCPDPLTIGLGNVFDTPFSTLWNEHPYRLFRRELKTGLPKVCMTCPDY